jgi:hypothetical protein
MLGAARPLNHPFGIPCAYLLQFYRVAFRKQIYLTIDELQAALDGWLNHYIGQRPHQGRWRNGQDANADLH